MSADGGAMQLSFKYTWLQSLHSTLFDAAGNWKMSILTHRVTHSAIANDSK